MRYIAPVKVLIVGCLLVICAGLHASAEGEDKTAAMMTLIYVDSSAALGGNGQSWATAYKYLQDALTFAATQTRAVEIWVAKGTYYPDQDEGSIYTEDDQNAAFTLLNDVEIYGGFKNNAVNRSDRNWVNQPTILSAEIATNTLSYHVIENIYTAMEPLTSTAILDGFVITRGSANAAGENGGAMYSEYSSSIIRNCHFFNNSGHSGGAVYNHFGAPRFENCIFSFNRCNFTSEGCAIFNFRSTAQIVNSTFTENKLFGNNKACIYNADSDIEIYNTILWNNDVEILNVNGASPTVSYCLIEGGYVNGTNIITDDPLFKDPTSNFQLKICSPAINVGLNAPSMATTDYGVVDRILYDQVDIGAYEYVTDRFYVDQDATTGLQNGSSWENAFIYLQDALYYLEGCGTPGEIWIAEGTYYPDKGLGQTNNDRTSAFKMLENVKIYGGFAGTETSINQRTGGNQVTLSGDIDGNNGNTDGNIAGNALHVIYNNYTAGDPLSFALLDQVSVGYGYADNASGAGIYNLNASPTFNNVIIFNNRTEIVGGGMFCENGSPTFLNCEFNINRAKRQGGGLYFRNGTATVSNTRFVGNVVEETDPLNEMVTSGGAIFAVDYNFNMSSCLFFQNEAISDAGSEGGAIVFKDYTILGAIQFTDCDFIENVARDGAAIFDPQSGSVFNNCNFLRNQTTQIASLPNGITFSGGAIYILDQDPTFNDCNFEDNTAQGRGGAVYNKEGSPEFNRCLFESNRGYPFNGADYLKGEGGAIYAGPGSGGSATNCSFFRNESSNHGGAIYLESISSLEVNNCEFLDNHAEYRGWSVACEDSAPEFINCTFANYSFTASEAFYNLNGANPSLTNCILWNHQTPFYEVGSLGSVVDHCLIQGGYSLGTNVIDADPLFVDPSSDDLSLQVCSPAIDVGLNSANSEPTDIVGSDRIFDAGATGTATIDLGAYEFSSLIGGQCTCVPIVKLDTPISTGIYTAGAQIDVCTTVNSGASIMLAAPVVQLEAAFEIPVGAMMEITSDGCE